jgi:hypothetical protein
MHKQGRVTAPVVVQPVQAQGSADAAFNPSRQTDGKSNNPVMYDDAQRRQAEESQRQQAAASVQSASSVEAASSLKIFQTAETIMDRMEKLRLSADHEYSHSAQET